MTKYHNPVLASECIELLVTRPDGAYFDATLGFGGHTELILNRLNSSALHAATDVDLKAFDYCRERFGNDPRVRLYNFNFDHIGVIAKLEGLASFTGIFADLGVSSFQLDNAESGFTYRENSPLDLRMDKNLKVNASDVLNGFDEDEIAKILFEFGEEKNSRKIAAEVTEARKRRTFSESSQLVELISRITPPNYHIKTLSRVFQALRIYVNDELGKLKSFLEQSVGLLEKGGRLVVLTYHSLEDRIVKDAIKYETLSCVCPRDFPICTCGKEVRLKILTKKPVTASDDEIRQNRRARSAKLRAAERL